MTRSPNHLVKSSNYNFEAVALDKLWLWWLCPFLFLICCFDSGTGWRDCEKDHPGLNNWHLWWAYDSWPVQHGCWEDWWLSCWSGPLIILVSKFPFRASMFLLQLRLIDCYVLQRNLYTNIRCCGFLVLIKWVWCLRSEW